MGTGVLAKNRFASGHIWRVACLAGLVLTASSLAATEAGRAAVMGGARALPLAEAVQRSRLAAEAVIQRRGKETCLRGKLTNALLGLSASCEVAAQKDGLCALADQAVVQVGWSLAFMDSTAQQVLNLIESQPGSGSGPGSGPRN